MTALIPQLVIVTQAWIEHFLFVIAREQQPHGINSKYMLVKHLPSMKFRHFPAGEISAVPEEGCFFKQ